MECIIRDIPVYDESYDFEIAHHQNNYQKTAGTIPKFTAMYSRCKKVACTL